MVNDAYLKYKDLFHYILILFVCIFISVLVFHFSNYKGYEVLFTQPLLFGLVYIIFLGKFVRINHRSLFFVVFITICFARYVVLPLLIVLSNHYGGRSPIEPDNISFFKAILLMNYELLIVSMFIAVVGRKKKRNPNVTDKPLNQRVDLSGNDLIYILTIGIALAGLFLKPSVLNSIHFLIPSKTELEPDFVSNLIIYFIIVSKQLLFVMITKRLFQYYSLSGKKLYIFLNFCIAFLNISVYFGTNRSNILISFIVSFLLLYKLYGKKMRKYILIGSICIVFIISIVTQIREYASISDESNYFQSYADTLQVYTGGPYNVAIAIETKDYFPEANNPSVLFFDIFRPMIGVNILVKDLPYQYSNIYFNKRIWLDTDRRSQILPMIGQGNLYFGFLLSPVFALLFISLYFYLEKRVLITNNLEVYYFLILVIVRLGFFMGQNTMNMINDLSMNLVLFLLIFYLNKIVKNSINPRKI